MHIEVNMIELSVSVTMGFACEQHNHDSGYRSTLDHVLALDCGEIELTPYVNYSAKINALLKPAIAEYNARRQFQYQKAIDRYNMGDRKTKPRAKDYQPMSYDYVGEHKRRYGRNPSTSRMEQMTQYRELIIKIANIKDRVIGNLPDSISKKICATIVRSFSDAFKSLHLLGATVHANEPGTLHLHLDFIPISKKTDWKSGLPVSLGLDAALQEMGLVPETSIMCTKSERIPILFNALRNRIFKFCEEALINHGYRMQYEATSKNYPSLDPSSPRSLQEFQYLSDHGRFIQHVKNATLDYLQKENFQVEDLSSALDAFKRITESVFTAKNVASAVCEFGYEVTENLLVAFHNCCEKIVAQEVESVRAVNSQISSATDNARELLRILSDLTLQCNMMTQKQTELQQRISELKLIIPQLEYKNAIGSQPKKYDLTGHRRISEREYNALLQIAERVNEVAAENNELQEENHNLKANLEYLIQCNLRMDALLKQYAPPSVKPDIRLARTDLTDMAVTNYYTQELQQIDKANSVLKKITANAAETIATVKTTLDKATTNSPNNTKHTSLDLQIKAVEQKSQGKRILSAHELNVVHNFGRLIGFRQDEIEHLLDYSLSDNTNTELHSLAIWNSHKTQFLDYSRSFQQEISHHLDTLYSTRQHLNQIERFLHPNNTRKSLWCLLFGIIVRLMTGTSLTEVESEIAFYKAARERLQQNIRMFKHAFENGTKALESSDFNLKEYIDAITQMYEASELAVMSILNIPLERQYILTDRGMTSKADIINEGKNILRERE